MEDPFLLVEAALTNEAKAAVLQAATLANPQLQGAKVADVLATYDDHDAMLWFLEPLYERGVVRREAEERGIPIEVLRAAAYAVALMLPDTFKEPYLSPLIEMAVLGIALEARDANV